MENLLRFTPNVKNAIVQEKKPLNFDGRNYNDNIIVDGGFNSTRYRKGYVIVSCFLHYRLLSLFIGKPTTRYRALSEIPQCNNVRGSFTVWFRTDRKREYALYFAKRTDSGIDVGDVTTDFVLCTCLVSHYTRTV